MIKRVIKKAVLILLFFLALSLFVLREDVLLRFVLPDEPRPDLAELPRLPERSPCLLFLLLYIYFKLFLWSLRMKSFGVLYGR